MEIDLSLKIDSNDFEQEVENHGHVKEDEKEEAHETTAGEIEDDDNTKIKEVYILFFME